MSEEEILKECNQLFVTMINCHINGKPMADLLALYKQEKEKNKELEEKLKIAVAMLTKGTYPEENEGDNDFDKQFIAVDKIKEKIEYLKNIADNGANAVRFAMTYEDEIERKQIQKDISTMISILQDLMEGK